MILDTLVTIFRADMANLKAGQKEATQGNEKLTQSFKRAEEVGRSFAKSLGESIKSLAAPLAALYAGGRIADGLKEQAEDFRNLTLQAQQFGQSAQDILAVRQAFVSAGAGAQEAEALINKLAKAQRDLALFGRSDLIPLFRTMGIAAVDAFGKVKPVSELLPDIAENISKMPPVRQQYLAQALGLSLSALELMKKGKDGVATLVREMKNTGPTKEQIEASNKLSLSLSALKATANSATTQFLSGLTPAFNAVVDVLRKVLAVATDVFAFLNRHTPLVVAGITALAVTIGGVFHAAVVSATAALWGMAAAVLANPLTWLIVGAIAAATAIAFLADDIFEFLAGNDSLVGALSKVWPWIGDLIKGVANFVTNAWSQSVATVTSLFDLLGAAAELVFTAIGAAVTALGQKFPWLKDVIEGIINLIIGILGAFWEASKGVFGFIADALENIFGAGKNIAINATTAIKQTTEQIRSGAFFGPEAANPSPSIGSVLGEASRQSRATSVINQGGIITNSNKQLSVRVDAQINTQATDAAGVAKAVGNGLDAQLRTAMLQMDDGIAI